jgi:mannose-6-phosphate isomerase-like protein (cupin superfamily)
MRQTNRLVPKAWGYEIHLTSENGMYYGKKLFIFAGHCTSWHYHNNKDEVFYVLSGALLVRFSEEDLLINSNPPAVRMSQAEVECINPGQSFRMKPLIRHRLEPTGDSFDGVTLIEFSNQFSDDSDTVRLVNGY